MSLSLIAINSLRKSYPKRGDLFSNFSLNIDPGEFVCILGSSGSGKSTLLKMILGLESWDSGTIQKTYQDSGVVFQEPRLLPWLTVAENIALPLRIKKRAVSDALVAQALDLARLPTAVQNSFPHELSGGMKMRAALARALIARPQVLFLDEPLSALDEPTRYQLQQDLRLLFERTPESSFVFITHSVSEAVYLASRIILLSPTGKIEFDYKIETTAARDQTWRYADDFNHWVKKVGSRS